MPKAGTGASSSATPTRASRHLQGSRAAVDLPADLVFEGMTVAALRGGRPQGASSICAANTATCSIA